MAKNKLPDVKIQDARMGVLLQAASARWEAEFSKSMQRRELLKTVLQLIDDGMPQNITALRGMIADAVQDVGE